MTPGVHRFLFVVLIVVISATLWPAGPVVAAVPLSLLGGKIAGSGGPNMFGLTLLSVGFGFLILGRKARCVWEGPCTEDPGGQG